MIFNKLIPELSVRNVRKSLEFYTEILGFTVEYSRPEDGFYFLSLEGSQIMIEEVNDNWWTGELEHPFGRGINFQIEVSARARADGYLLRFTQDIGERKRRE